MTVAITTLVKTQAFQEWTWLRKALCIFGWVFVAITIIPTVEGKIYPVFQNIHVDNARIEGERFCFTWHLDKKRKAKGIFYAAQFYMNDNPQYQIMGIEHYDGTPFGTTYNGTPVGHQDSTVCVHIKPEAKTAYRLGLRIFVKFNVANRPWMLDQEPIWVDYYSPG